jgi:hypothetical protein
MAVHRKRTNTFVVFEIVLAYVCMLWQIVFRRNLIGICCPFSEGNKGILLAREFSL